MLLTLLNFVIGYRFRSYVKKDRYDFPPTTPESLKEKEGLREIKEKARASSAIAGVFLAFAAAFVAALFSVEHLDSVLDPLRLPLTQYVVLLGVAFPFLIAREERRISAANVEASGRGLLYRLWHYFLLVVWCVGLIATFRPVFRDPTSAFGPALALSGFFLILISLLLLVLSVEFYDAAGGWQASDDPCTTFIWQASPATAIW